MARIASNRDLYLAVTALVARDSDDSRSLQEFLCALRAELELRYHSSTMTPDEFVAALGAALTRPVPPVEEAWREHDLTVDDEAPVTADTVDRILRSQILDMQDAARTGVLNDEYRYFGTTVERCGHHERATSDRWYNFDPATFIECGIVGTFGGWKDGDDTGRQRVPGDVAVIGADGAITTVSAEEYEDEVVPLDVLSWPVIADFLWAGQHYE